MLTCFRNGLVYDTDLRSFQPADLLVRDGTIEAVGRLPDQPTDAKTVDCGGQYVIPGLIDVHTHGRAGIDFNGAGPEDVEAVRRSYALSGTTTLMATLASSSPESLKASMEAVRANRMPKTGCANIAGIHLEGRYLNPVRRGIHPEALLAPLSPEELLDFIRYMSPPPFHISCAAELPGGESFVKAAVRSGATVGLAHSDATWEEARRAVEWGVTSFTHTFNAMRPIHHREPGIAAASLLFDRCYSELICDGEHVHPAMVMMAARLKPRDRLVLITDSMEAAGCPDGTYSIAGQTVTVKDGRASDPGGTLAGSTLDLLTALRKYIAFTGMTLEEAIPAATSNPAAMVGLDRLCGSIKPGMRADLLILKDRVALSISSVWTNGQPV